MKAQTADMMKLVKLLLANSKGKCPKTILPQKSFEAYFLRVPFFFLISRAYFNIISELYNGIKALLPDKE